MKLILSQFRIKIFLLIFLLSALLIYNYQISYNEVGFVEGMTPISLDFTIIISIIIMLIFLTLLIPKKIESPSDIFIFIYLFFVVYSSILFSSISIYVGLLEKIYLFLILVFPIITLKIIPKISLGFIIPKLIPKKNKLIFLLMILVLVITYSLNIGQNLGGFNFIEIYVRRIEGRDLVPDGSIAAYLITITSNAIVPFISFLSGLNKNKVLFVISLLSGLFFFWFLGLKGVIIYILFYSLLGYLIRQKNLFKLPQIILKFSIAIILISIFEKFIFDTFFINNFFIRRIFLVPGFLQSFYFDSIFENFDTFIYGKNISGYVDITYLIGLEYFQNPLINANTNSFLYWFLKFGFLGYFLNIFFIVFFVRILDGFYYVNKNSSFLFVACLSSILMAEQSFTTSLMSGGILFILILSIFSKIKNKIIKN